MDYIIKVNNQTHIYGMEENKAYKLLGHSEKGNYIIRNNSGELIEVHPSRAALLSNVTIKKP